MRAREAASERLDGELSEIDAARLDSHLRGCAECRAFAAGLSLVVGELRSAPLERPLTISFEPGRRHLRAMRMHGTVAAAAVALAAASIVLGRVHLGATSTAPSAATAGGAAASTVGNQTLKRQLFALLPPSDRWRAEFESVEIPPL